MIYTHVNVDLDAAVSVCCSCILHKIDLTEEFVQFVPASQQDFPEGEYAVLLDLEKNKHGPFESEVGRSFGEYLPRSFVAAVDYLDSDGHDSSQLRTIHSAIKKGVRSSERSFNDYAVCRHWYPIVEGLMGLKIQHAQSVKRLEAIPRVEIGGHTFLRMEHGYRVHGIGMIASDQGIVGQVYLTGFNIGITRYPDFRDPDFRLLPKLPGWYCDARHGHVYAFGTDKSPKKEWNPHFKNLDEFISWLRVQFNIFGLTKKVSK